MIIKEYPEIVSWPKRNNIFGIPVTPTNYTEAINCIMGAAQKGVSACIDFMPVHGLMTAVKNHQFKRVITDKFDMVCPDGQPVRWALNRFCNTGLSDRVYGPTLMLLAINRAQKEHVPVYFYGSRQEVLERLKDNLMNQFPELNIAGMQSPPFRQLSPEENYYAVKKVNESGARLLFVGLGCPKQELWAASQKSIINMPMLCVGAAFDFHAGVISQAPGWMQKRGMEWVYRLWKEPGRLWNRYLYYNLYYCVYYVRYAFTDYIKQNNTMSD